MQPRPINSPEEYAEAAARIEALVEMDPAEGSPEFSELNQWGEYIAAYEVAHFQYQ